MAVSDLIQQARTRFGQAPSVLLRADQSEQIDREEIRGARHLGAAVAGHGGSSLSVVLAGGLYRWISKALSTLHHRTHIIRRRIGM